MPFLLIAALAVAASTADAGEHRLRLDHRVGPVDVSYRSSVAIDHRQIGAAGPGGRASTLRCAWSAKIAVHRDARHSGGNAARSLESRKAISGSRPGWCATHRNAISAEVAQRSDELRSRLLAAAESDRDALIADLDRLHGAGTSGN